MHDPQHANHLVDETSPYLLQHAHNPVDWYPWGEEALNKARAEDKPIFLSVGYSACHWCHVMERESFEDQNIAAFLNECFVSIKVDREERPDIDNIYMDAVQIMTGQGGWPMSVWLDHELRPFFAGTYFPPQDRWGRSGFLRVLRELDQVWREERERIDTLAADLHTHLQKAAQLVEGASPQKIGPGPLDRAFSRLDRSFEIVDGGFSKAPKFPASMQCRLLLAINADKHQSPEIRDRAYLIAEKTLVRMASGGIYDHLGGGFHRYSVDRHWIVPHFEKMLYDNALLTRAYVEAYQVSAQPLFRRIVQETLDYILAEMVFAPPQNGAATGKPFYSTQDADTEGEEGKFFVWNREELEAVLGEQDAPVAADYWGVSDEGNFEQGRSVLNRIHALNLHGDDIAFEPLPGEVFALRRALLRARSKHIAPETDTKILAGWNGLMIGAMAQAGAALGEQRFTDSARSAARFVTQVMVEGSWSDDFELMRTFKDGRSRFPAYLDDYTFLASGLFALFEATLELEWLQKATRLVERAIELFAAEEGGFYFTAPHHKDLIVRQMDSFDGATPSANAVAIEALLYASALTGRKEFRDRAHQSLSLFFPLLENQPQAMTHTMLGLYAHVKGMQELVVLYPPGTRPGELASLRQHYLPAALRLIIEADENGQPPQALREAIPLLEGKTVRDERPTIYLCRDGVCDKPTFNL